MLETLAALRDTKQEAMLAKTAGRLLWDWRAAAGIMAQTWAKAEAKLHRHNPALRPLLSWVNVIRIRLVIEAVKANGYMAPTERAERAELARRIETLPITLREPMRLWLNSEDVPESLGWYVRQGLTLLGQRRAAA